MHVCSTPTCPVLSAKPGRCERCARERDRARGTRQERGYDASYDATRRDYQRRMDNGERFDCWRCPELGRPSHLVDPHAWHLGHSNEDRTIVRGPQCPASNLATAVRISPRA